MMRLKLSSILTATTSITSSEEQLTDRMLVKSTTYSSTQTLYRRKSHFSNTSGAIWKDQQNQSQMKRCLSKSSSKRERSLMLYTSKSGWGLDMQLCSVYRTKLCKWTSKITPKSCWVPRQRSLPTSTNEVNEPPTRLALLWIALTWRWLRDWSTRRTFSHICSIKTTVGKTNSKTTVLGKL